jgi:small subunit ribosomal protein S17
MTGTAERNRRKVRTGKVVSDRMDKTIVVAIERLVKHPVYGRYVRRRATFKVHDEKNECRVGDTVRFMETRRLSKDKRWRFVELVERAK